MRSVVIRISRAIKKSSYDDEEFERETDESEKELVTTHAKSIDEIFDFSNLDMVR
jgi:hypothetical protein